MDLQVVEYALQEIFLPALFQRDTAQIPGRAITGLPVKQANIALSKPTRTAGANWAAPCMITRRLVVELCGTAEFRSGDHALLVGKGRDEIRRRNAEDTENALGEAQADALNPDAHRLGRIQRTGA